MLIIAEDKKVLNLNYYAGVGIDKSEYSDGRYEFKAFFQESIDGYNSAKLTGVSIASIEEEIEAESAYEDFIRSIKKGENIWDVNDFKRRLRSVKRWTP